MKHVYRRKKKNTWANYIKINTSLLDMKLLMQIQRNSLHFLFSFCDSSECRQNSLQNKVKTHYLTCFLETRNETRNVRMMKTGKLKCQEKVYYTCQIINKLYWARYPETKKTAYRNYDQLYDLACGQSTEHERKERFNTDLHLWKDLQN